MPILNQTPTPPPRVSPIKKPDLPTVFDIPYQSQTVDTRYESLRSLLTHISGSKWAVRYYKQVVGQDSELGYLEVGKSPVYQQYICIEDFELKVTTPLSTSQNTENKLFETTGSAVLYPPHIPNNGDLFVADIGDGRQGIFSLTQTQRLSLYREACFEIEYVLIAHSDPARLDDLRKKTVQTLHFVKQLVEHNEDPFLSTEAYNQFLSVSDTYAQLLRFHLTSFYNKETQTLLVPEQDFATVDLFLVNALQALTNTDDSPLLSKLKSYNFDLLGHEPPTTLWDACLERSASLLPICASRFALVDSCLFNEIPQYQGVYFSNIGDVVYPMDRVEDLDYHPYKRDLTQVRPLKHQFKTTRLGRLSQLTQLTRSRTEDAVPIYPVTEDACYIFTEALYTAQETGLSRLERLVLQLLNHQAIDQETLFTLCREALHWGRLEQFYYIPFLLMLLKTVREDHF